MKRTLTARALLFFILGSLTLSMYSQNLIEPWYYDADGNKGDFDNETLLSSYPLIFSSLADGGGNWEIQVATELNSEISLCRESGRSFEFNPFNCNWELIPSEQGGWENAVISKDENYNYVDVKLKLSCQDEEGNEISEVRKIKLVMSRSILPTVPEINNAGYLNIEWNGAEDGDDWEGLTEDSIFEFDVYAENAGRIIYEVFPNVGQPRLYFTTADWSPDNSVRHEYADEISNGISRRSSFQDWGDIIRCRAYNINGYSEWSEPIITTDYMEDAESQSKIASFGQSTDTTRISVAQEIEITGKHIICSDAVEYLGIYDIHGAPEAEIHFPTEVSLENLAPGIYLITYVSNGETHSAKILIH